MSGWQEATVEKHNYVQGPDVLPLNLSPLTLDFSTPQLLDSSTEKDFSWQLSNRLAK
jgi:hypothetical protein